MEGNRSLKSVFRELSGCVDHSETEVRAETGVLTERVVQTERDSKNRVREKNISVETVATSGTIFVGKFISL